MPPRTYDETSLPLESSPEIFTSLAHNLGLSSTLEFVEVYDLDETPKEEVLAYVLAFPTTEGYDEMVDARDQKHYVNEDEAKEAWRVEADARSHGINNETVLWLRQTIHNACGLYALLHATCNGAARNHIKKDSILHTLLETPPSQRSSFLASSTDLVTLYTAAANQGDTPTPAKGEEVNWHYTAFVPDPEGEGVLELDGDRWGPLSHAELDDRDGKAGAGFGAKARRAIKKEYFEKDRGRDGHGMFSVLALTREGSG
ncbi:cysteine proteinase [Aureobasidium namibiae CBS 147.97]|uniref:Ubiquitin carboxyl-terminal hydrolase n=1 Tax=Aureobasidium namibiae CBS 147.97 TaxID=1043004 RepID=A0A074WXA2_9PEZI